jgi:hypothetical protein
MRKTNRLRLFGHDLVCSDRKGHEVLAVPLLLDFGKENAGDAVCF